MKIQRALPLLCLVLRVRYHALNQAIQRQRRKVLYLLQRLHRRQGQQLTDQLIQPLRLPLDPIQMRCPYRIGILARQLKRHAEPRQRRPQFVRDIPQQ